MKRVITMSVMLLGAWVLKAQEVYLLNIALLGQELGVLKVQNISQNKGYDNQPSFSRNGKRLFYAASRNGQTDIRMLTIAKNQYKWITNTAGSEYSPTPMPGKANLSAIKLDKSGYQRLWKFAIKNVDSSLLHPHLKIGYHAWLPENRLAVFVLDSDRSNSLRILDLNSGKDSVICTQPGRSIHRIPNDQAFSYLDKSDSAQWQIKRFDLATGQSTVLCNSLKGMEDYCWTPAGNLLMSQGSRIFRYNLQQPTDWEVVADLSSWGITGISRMAMQPQGQMMALVAQGD